MTAWTKGLVVDWNAPTTDGAFTGMRGALADFQPFPAEGSSTFAVPRVSGGGVAIYQPDPLVFEGRPWRRDL